MTLPRRRGSWALFLLGGCLLTTGYLVLRPTAPSAARPDPPPPPTTALPQVVCLGHVDVDGGVLALAPARAGQVIELRVQEGEAVASGAVLLRLDDRSARFDVEQARAVLDAARARLTRAEQDRRQHPVRLAQQRATVEAAEQHLDAARHQLERQRELLKINNTNVQDVRAAESQVKELEARVREAREKLAELNLSDPELPAREAKAEVAVAESRLHQAEYAVEQCELRAPGAGTVLRVQTGPGEVVGGPGAAAPLLFCPDRPFIVRAEVEQEFIRRLGVGQRAKVEDEVTAGAAWTGRVVRIAGWYAKRSTQEKPSAFKDVPTVECIIALDDARPGLRIGQRVQVVIGGE
jgi:multidrug resistance efflux pump